MQTVARFLETRTIQIILAILIILGAFFCIFTPNYFLFKWGESYAVQIMFGYLAAGLIFLLMRHTQLMFTSFACCAGLCLYLKDASNTSLIYPVPTDAPVIKIAQFSVSGSGENFLATIESIINTKAEFVSVQEIDPGWQTVLDEALIKEYPFSVTVFRPEDFQGIAIYSKTPFSDIDTFYHEDIPNLRVRTLTSGQEIHLMSAYIYPEFSSKDYIRTQAHFEVMCHKMPNDGLPIFTVGDFNEVQWSGYVRDFRDKCKLFDSRRFPSWVKRPTDHIFYSQEFQCVGFESIDINTSNHLGVLGTFQFSANVQQKAR